MGRRWKALDRIVGEQGSPVVLTSSIAAELATRVFEAASSEDPNEGRDLAAQLEAVMGTGGAKAPASARAAADGLVEAEIPEACAHSLGQLNFAYRVLATALIRRAEQDIEGKLCRGMLAPSVTALSRADLTESELAETLGKTPESVSRDLEQLRTIGAVERRWDATRFVHCLTPAAKLRARAAEDGHKHRPVADLVRLWVAMKTQELDPILRCVQSFSRSGDHPALSGG